MQEHIKRNMKYFGFCLLIICVVLAGAIAGWSVRFQQVQAAGNQLVSLTAQISPLLMRAHSLQPLDSNVQLHLSIGLTPRNEADMDSLLEALSDPASPQYGQYLTLSQFKQQFAPTTEQVLEVTNYLQSQGLTVTSVAPDNLLIDATGSTVQAEQAFHTNINLYQSGRHFFYANVSPPKLPLPIARLITSINGLDNGMRYSPFIHHQTPLAAAPLDSPDGLQPADITAAYNIDPLANAGIQGQQQTIALFEMDGYQQSDLDHYFQYYNITPPRIMPIMVDRFSGSAGQGSGEVEMDVEIVSAVAPQATILVYEGPNTVQGINDTYAKIVNDNRAQVVSISWGICEASTGVPEMRTLDTLFKQGALQGMSFFAAAGDAGAYDCQDDRLAVDSPASDPYVTGVGATTLQLNDGAYASEAVWTDPSQVQRGPRGAGSGGGLSMLFKLPSWQKGPGVRNSYSNGFRQVPDVTAAGTNGNPGGATGYSVYCTIRNAGCPATGWTTIEGTSAAAPLWAASMLLINQNRQANGKKAIGSLNSQLYKLFAGHQRYPAFHDISDGTNLFYPATPGYDFASGIGSPDFYNLARDLALS